MAEIIENEMTEFNECYNKIVYEIFYKSLKDSSLFTTDGKFSREHLKKCKELYGRDYDFITIDNSKGVLCSSYPAELIIPIKQNTNKYMGKDEKAGSCENFASNEYIKLLSQGRFARTRKRFPVPVFLVFGKHICRSSTLARSAEIYGHCGLEMINSLYLRTNRVNGHSENSNVHFKSEDISKIDLPVVNGNETNSNKKELIDTMRKTDIELLKLLNVHVICDLMVEKKKLKYGWHVTSSEKVDSLRRYDDFRLLSVPYPGCEFFAEYRKNNYDGKGLCFDWNQQFIDADLQIPADIIKYSDLNWNNYITWDLIKLTQNYLKLMLSCISSSELNGFLVHCISGWDRTPLFVSILRLSLWADDLIHQSLDAKEILYLTLVYDWLLFNHQFSDRIIKNEEILHFCFEFLRHICGAEYSLVSAEEEAEEVDEEQVESGQKTPMGWDSASDSEQMFQIDLLNDCKPGYSSSNHSSDCNSAIPVDFTSRRQKLYSNSADRIDESNKHIIDDHPLNSHHVNGHSHLSSSLKSGILYGGQNSTCAINGFVQSNKNEENKQINSDLITAIPCNNHSNNLSSSLSMLSISPKKSPDKDLSLIKSVDDKLLTNKTTPLSSSFDDSKNHNGIVGGSVEQCRRLSAALSVGAISTGSTTRNCSNPIYVPTKHRSHKAMSDECLSNESGRISGRTKAVSPNSNTDSPSSINGNMTEPGSSWQMVGSLPSTYQGFSYLNSTSEFSTSFLSGVDNDVSHNHSIPKVSSVVSSEASLLNGECNCSCEAPQPTAAAEAPNNQRNYRLKRRKQRLEAVRDLMIPSYKAALNTIRTEQDKTSSILSFISNTFSTPFK